MNLDRQFIAKIKSDIKTKVISGYNHTQVLQSIYSNIQMYLNENTLPSKYDGTPTTSNE